MPALLLGTVFVIATCGLIYELVAGTLASYLLGDSVTQFSTVIGVYLFSMGVGSWLTKFIRKDEEKIFVTVEFLIALVGGSSAGLLFLLFEHVESFRVLLYFLVFLTGALVGVEIPLVMRILQTRFEFKDLVARVFAFDYVGALIASLLFPLVLVPKLGLMRSSFVFGMLNAGVGFLAIHLFRQALGSRTRKFQLTGVVVLGVLGAGAWSADRLMKIAEEGLFPANVIFAKTTPYQRIVMTREHEDLRLYLNSHLQFSSQDEYRYHESLVHPLLAALPQAKSLLVLGGGDGMAVREALRYPNLENITLVDLDSGMTELFKAHPIAKRLNQGALSASRVRVVNDDAFQWMKKNELRFDAVIVDFPDPANFSIGKLYSTTFYRELKRHLAPAAAVVIQSTSPLVARKSYWCIVQTLEEVGFQTLPYHGLVPSFGEWGYVIASAHPFVPAVRYPDGLRYLNHPRVFETMQEFPGDMSRIPAEPNLLNNQMLVRLYENEWSEFH